MSRFDDDRFRAQLATILDQMVLSHYPEAGLMTQLQLYVGDDRSDRTDRPLVELVVAAAQQFESGELRTTSEFLAATAIQIARQQHRLYCPFDGNAACERDVRAANDLLIALAEWMCDSRLDGPEDAAVPILDGPVSTYITDATTSFDSSVRELGHHLYCLTRPRGDIRKLPPITAERPILQMNAAITRMPWGCYQEVKRLTSALKDSLSDTYEVECTNEYAHPLRPAPPSELVTRAGVYRSAGLIVFSEHGGIGTGRTLEIATATMIPVLILQRVDADHPRHPLALRFDGGLSRPPVLYSTDDEAARAVEKFLRVNMIAIYERARRLAEWSEQGLSAAHRVASELRDVWPAGAQLTHEQALWWLEGVHWQQAPTNVREVILELISFIRESGAGRSSSRAATVVRRSSETLRTYQRKIRLEPKRAKVLWLEYMHRLTHTPAVSSRRDANSSWEVADWEQLDSQLDAE